MALNRIITLLGILIFLMPFLGFPGKWEDIFFIVTGLLVAVLGSFHVWQKLIIKRIQIHSTVHSTQSASEE